MAEQREKQAPLLSDLLETGAVDDATTLRPKPDAALSDARHEVTEHDAR